MATIRFRELIKAAGKPESKSLWSDPKDDRQFMKAVKQNRVLTIVLDPSSKKKEFGEIGFHQDPHANYFVFPEPLPTGPSKVIGIKYELIEETKPKDAVSPKDLKCVSGSKSQSRVKKAEPVLRTFNFAIRRVATIEATIEVKARNKREAKSWAIKIVEGELFDLAKANIKNKIYFKE